MPEKPPDPGDNLRLLQALLMFALHGFTWIGEVFLHGGHGWLYPAPVIRLIAVGLPYGFLIVWVEKAKRQGCPATLAYLALLPTVLFWLMLAQWVGAILVRHRTSSRYTGIPLLHLPLFFLDEAFLKPWLEPALLLGVSWWFYAWNPPLMSLVVAVGVSLFLVGRLRRLTTMLREQGLTDAIHKSW